MIFVDSGPFYALYVPADQNHAIAVSWLQDNTQALVTTSFVVAEALTLLRARKHFAQALALSRRLRTTPFARIEWVTQPDYEAAWSAFEKYRDKAWSFTDCTSRALIERLNIREAFAFDEHFRQFGIVTVVP